MISDIFTAFFVATLPVGFMTWFVMGWALKSGRLQPYENREEFKANLEAMQERVKEQKKADKKAKKDARKQEKAQDPKVQSKKQAERGTFIKDRVNINGSDFFHAKWMQFGGGFYGSMAFYTMLYIEFFEIIDFLVNITLPENFGIGPFISLVVTFFVNSIKNLITAFIWFTYWPDILPAVNGWILLLAAWIGFTLGGKLARTHQSRLHEPEELIKQGRAAAKDKWQNYKNNRPKSKNNTDKDA